MILTKEKNSKRNEGTTMGKTYEPGVYPQNWENMPLEGKIWHLYAKWDSIRDDDMYELCMNVSPKSEGEKISVSVYIWPKSDHKFTENGTFFVQKFPHKFDRNDLPDFLKSLLKDLDDLVMLESGVSAESFEEAVNKMFLFLDLLAFGYEITEYEWYREKHPELFDNDEEDEEEFSLGKDDMDD